MTRPSAAPVPFTTELREAAAKERDETIRFNLRLFETRINAALMSLAACPTDDALRTLNSEWAGASRLMRMRGQASLPGID